MNSGRSERPNMPDCKVFECKAGQRPIQKQESSFKAFALDFCINDGTAYGADSPYAKRAHFTQPLAQCCLEKNVCFASCGISYNTCYKRFWKCAEQQCDMSTADLPVQSESPVEKAACIAIATFNDANHVWVDRNNVSNNLWTSEDRTCKRFLRVQKLACDCVDVADSATAWKSRVEGFLSTHVPEKLNKKGEIKDKKLWPKWKGRRPEMMLELMLGFPTSIDIQRKDQVQMPRHNSEL